MTEEHCLCCNPPSDTHAPLLGDYLDVFYYGATQWARRLQPNPWRAKWAGRAVCCCVTSDCVWAIARAINPTFPDVSFYHVPNLVKFSLTGERLFERWFPFGFGVAGTPQNYAFLQQFAGAYLLALPDGGCLIVGWMSELDADDVPVATNATRNAARVSSAGDVLWYSNFHVVHRVITSSPDGLSGWNGGGSNLTLDDAVIQSTWIFTENQDWGGRCAAAGVPAPAIHPPGGGNTGFQDDGSHIVTASGVGWSRWSFDRKDWWLIGAYQNRPSMMRLDGTVVTFPPFMNGYEYIQTLIDAGFPTEGIGGGILDVGDAVYDLHGADYYRPYPDGAGSVWYRNAFPLMLKISPNGGGPAIKKIMFGTAGNPGVDGTPFMAFRIMKHENGVPIEAFDTINGTRAGGGGYWYAKSDEVYFQCTLSRRPLGFRWNASPGTATPTVAADSCETGAAIYPLGAEVMGFLQKRQPASFRVVHDVGDGTWTGGTFRIRYRGVTSRRTVSYTIQHNAGFPVAPIVLTLSWQQLLRAAWRMRLLNTRCGERYGLHATEQDGIVFLPPTFFAAHGRDSEDFGPNELQIVDHLPEGDVNATIRIDWLQVGVRETNFAQWDLASGDIIARRNVSEDFGVFNHLGTTELTNEQPQGPVGRRPNYVVSDQLPDYVFSHPPFTGATRWTFGWQTGSDIFNIGTGAGSQVVPWHSNGAASTAGGGGGMVIGSTSRFTEDALRW